MSLLPDYLENDLSISVLPSKDELRATVEDTKDQEIVKKVIFYIASKIMKTYNPNDKEIQTLVVPFERLKFLGFKEAFHENIVKKFFVSKGYLITVESDNSFKITW